MAVYFASGIRLESEELFALLNDCLALGLEFPVDTLVAVEVFGIDPNVAAVSVLG